MRTGERGFTYLWLLFLLAMGGAAMAAAGQRWSSLVQGERERELIYRGEQIAAAIESYRHAEAGGPGRWPTSWDQLIDDSRGPVPRRHLRRIYADPFTGDADWEPILNEDGQWRGVRSRSQAPARLVREGKTPGGALGRPRRVRDHEFVAKEPAATAPAVVPPGSGAGAAADDN